MREKEHVQEGNDKREGKGKQKVGEVKEEGRG